MASYVALTIFQWLFRGYLARWANRRSEARSQYQSANSNPRAPHSQDRGTAWSDKALGTYAAIPTANYAAIEVPTADFGQQLKDVTKLRLRFAVTGGEKIWQIDEISAAK